MTREEQIIVLTNAQERAFKQIDLTEGCEMGTEEFQRLIYVTDHLNWMLRNSDPMPVPEIVPEEVQPEAPKPEPEQVQPEPEPEKPVENVDNDETEDPEEPKFKMEEVRAALAKARGRGVNVTEIIRSFGADNFQQITKNQYGAIMAKLTEV